MFSVLFTSDSNDSAVPALSEKNSSIVDPNIFPVKFFSFFIVHQRLLVFVYLKFCLNLTCVNCTNQYDYKKQENVAR